MDGYLVQACAAALGARARTRPGEVDIDVFMYSFISTYIDKQTDGQKP